MAQAEAERQATRIVVPDEDRPAEARAILSAIDGLDGTVSWQNPVSGAYGRVTIRAYSRGRLPGDIRCRMVAREWRGAAGARRGNMMACASRGIWYDLS